MKHSVIVPTVTAYDTHDYRQQMQNIEPFADRIHVDLMDGEFAPTTSPDLTHIWWPHHAVADVHLMYMHPAKAIAQLLHLKPHMIVIHAEAKADHMYLASLMHKEGVKAGIAILAETPVATIERELHSFDHVLVFSGKLGFHGGAANMKLLDKVKQLRRLDHTIEIGWDGGVAVSNARQLMDAGVDVLNVGGAIQKAKNPENAYATLLEVMKG